MENRSIAATPEPTPTESATVSMPNLIPLPLSVQQLEGGFTLGEATTIQIAPDTEETRAVGEYLAERLRPTTGYALTVSTASEASEGAISLVLTDDEGLGEEGYTLEVTADGVQIAANRPAGLFYGVQTLRQLLPPEIERGEVQEGPWTLPAVTIRDVPRFAWRGAMLDVARHFFGVEDVKRYIDLLAAYKMNRLHLHLSDDQGWRIEIASWPNLTATGGQTAVAGDPGGFYTQAEYREIVAYAQSRYVVVVPEIDVPGHTNAALNAYPELNCDGVAPKPYTGVDVGFSSLCIEKEITYTFMADVIRELAAMTPGPYLHMGGDEALSTPHEAYQPFMERVQEMVVAEGKQMVGWEEVVRTTLHPTTLVQQWHREGVLAPLGVKQGVQFIMSPAEKAYLDMKYDAETVIGHNWAGYTEVQDSYEWDPATIVPGIGEENVVGVEAPLWSETLRTIDDIEYMAFPRLPGIAEIGWSAAEGREWETYRERLGAHGPRLEAMGANFYRAASVPWQ